jgi:O-antigen/teichoic acid export membrane protein
MLQRFTGLFKGSGVRAASMRSGSWTLFEAGAKTFLRLISNVILTRILSPEIFGLMALANTFLGGIALMSDVGTGPAVIRSSRGDDPTFLRTAWTLQIIRGFVIATVACLLAYPASRFYEEPSLFPIVCVLAATAVFGGFTSISVTTASRNMQLARLSIMRIGIQSVNIVVMVVAAMVWESVWALVLGALNGAALNVLLGHFFLPRFQHRVSIERAAFVEILRYGRWVMLGTIFFFLGGRGITLVHGTLVPLEILGVLALSTNLVDAVETIIQKLHSSVAFPAFARVLRERAADLPRVVAKMRWIVVAPCVGLFVVVSVISQPVIDLLYDDRYTFAGSFLALQALNGALRVMGQSYQNLMLTTGDSRMHAIVMFTSAAGAILGTLAGFFLLGPLGMILGVGLGGVLSFMLSLGFAWRRGCASLALDVTLLAIILSAVALTFASLDPIILPG